MRAPMLLAVIVVSTLSSCASNPVTGGAVSHAEDLKESEACAITQPGQLSLHSMKVLRMLALDEGVAEDPAGALARLEKEKSGLVDDWEHAMAEAELHYVVAEGTSDVAAAQKDYVDAALCAVRGMRSVAGEGSFFDPRQRLLAELYNRSLSRAIALGQELYGAPSSWKTLGGRPFRVVVESGLVDPAGYDKLIPAQEVRQVGIPNQHRRYGAGSPLIAVKDNRMGATERKDPWRPPTIAEPLTAALRPGADGSVELLFLDPVTHPTFTTRDGRTIPLYADFTSPLAWLVANSPAYTKENSSLFSPESFAQTAGLYFAQPYDPKRIPVVMVHGLWSSPLTWIWLMNEVWGDPVLRDRYQVWFYAYPTGLPITLNAASFHEKLNEVRRTVDPEGDDPATHDMVLVGHSMGGLLSAHMVKQIGADLWNAKFSVPYESIRGTAADTALLKRCFYFEPIPWVKRVVFMATPHRGSSLAEGIVGWIGSGMITLPKDLEAAAARLAAENPGALRTGPGTVPGVLNSIDSLRSDSVLLGAVCQAAWSQGLPFHSIIGDEEKAGRVDGSDGVVPYRSSHLDGAVSECIVHCNHNVTSNPEALLEARRILRLHLAQSGGMTRTN